MPLINENLRQAISRLGEKSWLEHEQQLADIIREVICVKLRLGKVSIFISKNWEVFAIGESIPQCLKTAKELMQKLRNADILLPESEVMIIEYRFSKTRSWERFLSFVSWIAGILIGRFTSLIQLIAIAIIYLSAITFIIWKEEIYSRYLVCKLGFKR
jgi:hypothetical protein